MLLQSKVEIIITRLGEEGNLVITIENEQLSVTIDPNGAQLHSIMHRSTGREFLWQGNPDIWNKRAPVLFPLIGRLRDGRYTWNGTDYQIPTHGFAIQSSFIPSKQEETCVTFSISDTPQTRVMYPFGFRFSVTYSLEGNCIHKVHQIENTQKTPLYYELGGHDGYRVPFESGEVMADCHIRLPGLETLSPYEMDERVMIQPKVRNIPLARGEINLNPSTYGLDTVIIDQLPKHRAELLDRKGRVRLAVEFEDFEYLALWTKDHPFDTGFVCIEPWTSLPDAAFVGRDLSSKAGIRCVSGGETQQLRYNIVIYG